MKKTRNILVTICGVLAVVGAFAAVCVMDGSAHEMTIRCAGAGAFAVFAMLWISAIRRCEELTMEVAKLRKDLESKTKEASAVQKNNEALARKL